MAREHSPFDAVLRCVQTFRALNRDVQLGSIIAFLHVCGDEGVPIKYLAHLYGFSESSMSRHVHALAVVRGNAGGERRPGLVKVTPHPEDGRRRLVFLTSDGRRIKEAIRESLKAVDR